MPIFAGASPAAQREPRPLETLGAGLHPCSSACGGHGKVAYGHPEKTPKAGIARLAASAPKEREGHEVEYFRLPVRSVLNHVDSRRVGFEWSINPYRGCEFGCQYCYARYTHEYMELDPRQFENKIYVKEEAARILRRDLSAGKVLGRHIAIGAATDPYQPAERRFRATRAILETLLEFSRTLPKVAGTSEAGGLSLSITTKSNLVLRDLDLLRELSQANRVHVNVSVTTLNARLARTLEPRAPRPDLRLEAVHELRRAGISTGVFALPILPGITDNPEELEALVAAAARAGARYLCAGAVFLMPSSQKTFFPFLQRKFPRLLKQYRKWFRVNGYAPEAYRKKISVLMRELRAKHGLADSWPEDDTAPNYSALAASSASGPSQLMLPQLALPFAS